MREPAPIVALALTAHPYGGVRDELRILLTHGEIQIARDGSHRQTRTNFQHETDASVMLWFRRQADDFGQAPFLPHYLPCRKASDALACDVLDIEKATIGVLIRQIKDTRRGYSRSKE